MSGRKSFVFPDDDAARLERLKTQMRGATGSWVVTIALKVLDDLVSHRAADGRIEFRAYDGSTQMYDPLLDTKK